MMFWTKLKVTAAVAAAVSVVGAGSGILAAQLAAGEPAPVAAAPAESSKLPVNPRVAAMGDNTWMKLETPKAHPMTRSSSPWMPYAPEAGVGILWGCSHSGYHNDLWTYNLAANEWKEMLKTEPSAVDDPGVLKYKDGVLMTREERPLSMHQWGLMDYDPDRQVLWHVGGSWQGTVNIPETYKKHGKEVTREGDPEKYKKPGAGPLLWKYDLKANKWSLTVTEDPTGCTRYRGAIRYCPAVGKLIMLPCMVTPNEDRERFKAYDPATNKWAMLNVAWKPLDKDVSPYWVYGSSPVVYDAKRKALVFIFGGGGTWLLDPVAKTMEQVVPRDKSLPANLDGPQGAYVYDSAGAATLGIFPNYTQYDSGKVLEARGFPTDRANVWVLDVEKKEWALQPKPADGVLPPLNAHTGNLHHFYDPVTNATMIFRGGYNGMNGETWVYRYKRTAK